MLTYDLKSIVFSFVAVIVILVLVIALFACFIYQSHRMTVTFGFGNLRT